MKEKNIHAGSARGKATVIRRATSVFAALAVFITTYALILPAITMEAPTYCNIAAHTHDASCMESTLICGYEEGQTLYTEQTEQVLVCEDESPEHVHDDSCYETVTVQVENGVHQHEDACYEQVLVCGQEEHVHSLQCFSDPAADTGDGYWIDNARQALTLLDDNHTNHQALLSVAMSQTGYAESTLNYEAQPDGVSTKGYSIYGAACGQPYADWDAAFVAWCVSQAGIQVPAVATADEWLQMLSGQQMLYGPDYTPIPGDLAFYQKNGYEPMHMGVVFGTEFDGETLCAVELVAGDSDTDNVTLMRFSGGTQMAEIQYFGQLADEYLTYETPADESVEVPANEMVPAEEAVPAEELPAAETGEASALEPAGETAEDANAEPAEEPAAETAQEPVEEPAEVPAEVPAEEPAEPPVEKSAGEPAEERTEDPDAAPVEALAEEPAAELSEAAPEENVLTTETEAENPSEDPAKEEPAQAAGEEALAEKEPAEAPAEEPVEEPAEEPAEEPEDPADYQITWFQETAGNITVTVAAAADAFPAGTQMRVAPVDAEAYTDVAESAVDGKVHEIQALDISFWYHDSEIEPAGPVKVWLTTEEAEPVVVHVDEAGEGTVVASELDAGAVSFVTDGFSVYLIVGTETIETTVLTADGSTLKVTINYDENAQIPSGAVLEVKEIQENDEGWGDRSSRLAHVLSKEYGNVYISDARFLEISIMVDGEEFEPKAPVEIKVEYTNALQTEYTVDSVDTDPDGLGEYAGFEQEKPELESRFAIIHYSDNKEEILESDFEQTEDVITESVTMTSGFSDYDIANFDLYEAPEATLTAPSETIGTKKASEIATLAAANAPMLRSAGDTPAHNKTLKDNLDGTYTIGLNVTGDADTTQETSDVNVIMVYDVSSSMTIYHAPSATGRYAANDGYSTTYPQLYQRTGNNSYSALTNDNYTGTVYTRTGNYGRYTYNEYTGQRFSALWRADVAEKTLKDFTTALFGYQNAEKDNINAALVTFDATARTLVNWTQDVSDITGVLNGSGTGHASIYGSGTNWEGALVQANNLLNSVTNDAPTYVVFITDGAPTQSETQRNKTTDTERMYDHAKDNARDVYTGTTATGGEFYSIYAFGTEADYLASLMYYAYNETDPSASQMGTTFDTAGYYNASDAEALTAAINEIFEKIVQTLGISGVSIDDGTTSNVSTGTGVAHLLEVDESSYQYWLSMPVTAGATSGTYTFTMVDKVSGDPVTYTATPNASTGEVTITWDGGTATYPGSVNLGTLTLEWTGAKAFYNVSPPAANFNSNTGEVEWNLNPAGTLLDGVTYTVTFDCYPSQWTLDLIADLKNGYVTYGDESYGDVWGYLEKNGDDYKLKTNTTATLTYTDTRTENGEQTIGYVNPDPEPVSATEEIAVSKNWSNTLDSRDNWISQTIHLYVTRDGVERNYVTLNAANNWSGASWISYGIMTIDDDGTIDIKTTGHDYSFSEEAAVGYYWEIKADTIRPMLINNHITTLKLIKEADAPDAVKTEAANAVAEVGDDTYYKLTINGEVKYYVVDEGAASLNATNHRRSYLDVLKTVTGGNVPEGDEFEFTMTVTNSRSEGSDPDDIHSDAWVWFSVADSNNSYAMVTDPDIATAEGIRWQMNDETVVSAKPETDFNGYFCVPSGTPITVNMQNGYNLRFLNLPEGSAYSISESTTMPADGYSFVSIAGERGFDASGVKEDPNTDWTTETAGTADQEAQSITGNIDYVESAYKVTVTNKWNTIDVKLKKIDENGDTLDGSVFTLTRGESTVDTYQPGVDHGNPVDLGGLGIGIYKLEETTVPNFYEKAEDVFFQVYKDTDGSLKARLVSSDGNELADQSAITSELSADGLVYTITVTNTRADQLVSVWKTDMDHNTLTGASFALYKAEDYDASGINATPVVSATAVGTNGILPLGNLAVGSYYLVEMQAPAGYNPLESPVCISVRTDGVTAIQDGNNAEVARNVDGNEYRQYWVAGQDDATWQIRVWNNPGVELPSTGGIGTRLFYLIGSLLALGAVVLLITRRITKK